MRRNKAFLSVLVLGMLLPIIGCQKNVSSSEITSSSSFSSEDWSQDITSSEDNTKEIEAHLKELTSAVAAQIPTEITEDYVLPTIDEEGYDVDYEADQSTIENGVLKYIAGRDDIVITLTITVSYDDLEHSVQAAITMKGVPASDEGLREYLTTYLDKLPTLIKGDYVLPYINHEDYQCTVKVDGQEVSHHLVKYPFPEDERQPANFNVTVKNTQTGTELSDNKSFLFEKASVVYQIPKMYIDTSNVAITSKENYVTGFITLEEADGSGEYVTTLNRVGMKIRGRGNSTWSLPKKPYKVKFNSKTSLFGEKAQKDWVLLANYVDHTLIRDYLAKNLGRTLDGFAFTPSTHFIDLYLNNEYQGSYMVTDQVEVKVGRVDVEQDSSNPDTGYLVELDQRLWENGAQGKNETWFEINARDGYNSRNLPFDIKYPETDEEFFTHDQLLFIQDYMQTAINKLSSGGNWQDYIDLKSAVDFFIVEDLFKNVDVGYASAFMYKDKGGKLFFGPLWDFDLSSLNQGHIDSNQRQYYDWYSSRWDKNSFCYFFMKDNTFRAALKQRWQEWYPNLLDDVNALIDHITAIIETSRIRNFEKWDIIGKNWDWYTSSEVYNAKTYDAQIALLKGWFNDRIGWMNTQISNF